MVYTSQYSLISLSGSLYTYVHNAKSIRSYINRCQTLSLLPTAYYTFCPPTNSRCACACQCVCVCVCICLLEGLVKANNRPQAVTLHPLDWIFPPLQTRHHESERNKDFQRSSGAGNQDHPYIHVYTCIYSGYFTDMFRSIYFYYTTRIASDRLGKNACKRELGQFFAGRLIHCISRKKSVYRAPSLGRRIGNNIHRIFAYVYNSPLPPVSYGRRSYIFV